MRGTGSGMGCPDWPKCFGQWVPPTQVSQLPDNYQAVYVQQRVEKNKRFSTYLSALGFANLAQQIQNDPSIREEEDFNATKTWIEYLNRLLGAIVGLLILATFVVSLGYRKLDPRLVVVAFATLITVALQGWIGSIVVSTNLLPWMITVHMLLALVIVALLTIVVIRTDQVTEEPTRRVNRIQVALGTLLVLSLVQIVMGTQVRESVNEVAHALGEAQRSQWVDQLDWVFYVHRSYSIVLLLGHAYLVYLVYQNSQPSGNLMRWSVVLLGVVMAEIVSGAVMAYFAIPRVAQPLHLLFATLTFGIQSYLMLWLSPLANRQPLLNQRQYVSH